ncbi:MAG TPA: hypothetical protein GX499_04530 [Clostridiales bacterium]|nr:hypothetical protein [Clostridiales bacterium]
MNDFWFFTWLRQTVSLPAMMKTHRQFLVKTFRKITSIYYTRFGGKKQTGLGTQNGGE